MKVTVVSLCCSLNVNATIETVQVLYVNDEFIAHVSMEMSIVKFQLLKFSRMLFKVLHD